MYFNRVHYKKIKFKIKRYITQDYFITRLKIIKLVYLPYLSIYLSMYKLLAFTIYF